MTPASNDGFRPGEDFAVHDRPPPEPAVLGFTEAAKAGGTDFDVLMGYQLLLGRDPENSFVIADAKTSPVGAFIRALLGSGEFQSAVVEPIRSGRRLPHEAASAAPSKRQRDWLFRHISLPPDAEIMLRTAPSWRDWMRVLLSVPGMPQAQAQADTAPSAPETVAKTADEGFVLIHLEQPAAGEAIHPGMRVNGSGWTIAPDDVSEVAILLDDQVLTHARYGLPRPDVARGFPHYRHVDHCGFSFVADIPQTARVSAASRLVVRVRTGRGDEGEKGVRLLPPPATPAAAESDAAPMRLAIDEAVIDEGRVLRLRGWAAAQAGIGSVRVALGKSELGPAVTGLSRPDIAKANPDTADADKAGFALVIGLPPDLPAGPSFVRVQASDARGQTRQVSAPVTVPPAAKGARSARSTAVAAARLRAEAAALPEAADLRLELDQPLRDGNEARETLRGALSISGWAVARTGIDGIAVFIDGTLLGAAHVGMRREDIGATFPDFPGSLLAGYALVLPPGALPEGRHQIRVVAHAKSADGATAARAEKRFFLTVDLFHAVPPGGEPRLQIAPAEAELGVALLAQAGFHPAFVVLVAAAGKASLPALARSLASLSAQVYPAWTAQVFAPPGVLAAARGLPEAAGHRFSFAGARAEIAKRGGRSVPPWARRVFW